MIRVSAPAVALVRRLLERASRLAEQRAATQIRRGSIRRPDWHSATDLWPEFTGDRHDGE